MSKEQIIDLIRLLSALESWSYSVGKRPPDYLLEDITIMMEVLTNEVLK